MQMSKIDKRKLPNAWTLDKPFSCFSNLIPCFSPPTFYLSVFTVVDDKLILDKFILTLGSCVPRKYI